MRICFSVLFISFILFGSSCNTPSSITGNNNPQGKDNIAYYWAEVALEATARDTERFNPRPTITSRYLGLIFTAVFDAWSVYDNTAHPVYLKHNNKESGTLMSKEIAVSYAAYKTLLEYYPNDSIYFKNKLLELRLNPNLELIKKNSPAYYGLQAANDVIEARKNDGSNQYGLKSRDGKTPYEDYSEYQPVNTVDKNTDINRWQPKYFISKKGENYAPECLTPYWHFVDPISLDSSDEFRSPPPPMFGSDELNNQIEEVVELQKNLTSEQKALVEFMRDGPKSVQQAGHWLLLSQELSKKRKHTIDEDVKMYFLNQIVAMDAFIASWDTKMFYDYARPYALVHEYYKNQEIKGWKGFGKGWGSLKGEMWRPYSPDIFLCPPFPSYVSGHSTVSGACAEALRLFTESDDFDITVPFISGSYTEPSSEWEEVELHFPTLTEAAEMAGFSRVLGGYHIQADNIEGLVLGRKVARKGFQFYLNHIGQVK